MELDFRAIHSFSGSEDIQNMRSHLDREVDPVDFSDSEKQRNTFLYRLLSSLVRQRALLVVRQTTGNNGLEAYRTLIQQNEPTSKNRSMGLLNVIMNWPTFSWQVVAHAERPQAGACICRV